MPLAATLVTAGAICGGGGLLLKYLWRPQMMEALPDRMNQLVLVEANTDVTKARLEVQCVDTPKPRRGQVLVKMFAAPINPSDDGIWKVAPKEYPVRLGNEGSGVVVGTGGGGPAWRLLGKKVTVVGAKTYSEYVVVDALTGAWSLPPHLPVEDGCSFFVNPLTVVGIIETLKERGGKALIHTAAASQLGQMMVKYCKVQGITIVNVVRRQEQADVLRALGAELIVVTDTADWKEQLKELIKQHQLKFAFDAIAGEMSGTLLQLLPPKSTVFVYGRLAPEKTGGIDPLDLIYREKKLEGWLLTRFLMKGGPLAQLLRSVKVGKLVRDNLDGIFKSSFKDTAMKDAHATYSELKGGAGLTGSKVRIRMVA
eukprot:gnl/TRDRNA2_/TRDRNA2_44208_c0_seq1.p1 gnl/TRDRNA2_/TRDRNA2_44208_c0~~gnl/TRDRNA2_/TRDRNA2_44208_c0_seq1.p1  ORF type:complete len:385 (-),score=73.64 gnl/TRDRNA2_/TRDRNA2_44208_c0_seq1:61-1167(-)